MTTKVIKKFDREKIINDLVGSAPNSNTTAI